jgi:hypothetical protein
MLSHVGVCVRVTATVIVDPDHPLRLEETRLIRRKTMALSVYLVIPDR